MSLAVHDCLQTAALAPSALSARGAPASRGPCNSPLTIRGGGEYEEAECEIWCRSAEKYVYMCLPVCFSDLSSLITSTDSLCMVYISKLVSQ